MTQYSFENIVILFMFLFFMFLMFFASAKNYENNNRTELCEIAKNISVMNCVE